VKTLPVIARCPVCLSLVDLEEGPFTKDDGLWRWSADCGECTVAVGKVFKVFETGVAHESGSNQAWFMVPSEIVGRLFQTEGVTT